MTKEKTLDLLKQKDILISTEVKKLEFIIKEKEKDIISLKARFSDSKNHIFSLNVRPQFVKKTFSDKMNELITGVKKDEKIFGYIFYMDSNLSIKIFEILDNDDIFNMKNQKNIGEKYMLHEYFGTFKGKPFFLIKYPYAISLKLFQEVNDVTEPALAYDARAYYNLIEHTIKRQITKISEGTPGLVQDILKYWWVIAIVVLFLVLLFSPQGQTFLNDMLKGFTVS